MDNITLSPSVLLGGSTSLTVIGGLIRHYLLPQFEAQVRKEIDLGIKEAFARLSLPEDKIAVKAVYAAFKAHHPDAEAALPAMIADDIVTFKPGLRPYRDDILKQVADLQTMVLADMNQAVQAPVVLQPPPADASK